MREQQNDSVQNQFTAYLVSAITNIRINYFDKRLKRRKREVINQNYWNRVLPVSIISIMHI